MTSRKPDNADGQRLALRKRPTGQYVWMVARQVARHKQGLVEIWLGDSLDDLRAQPVRST
jgi:hypothetical protein